MMKRNVRLPLVAAIAWAALLLPYTAIFHLELTPPISCGPDCTQLSTNLFFGVTGNRVYLLVAIPLIVSLAISLLIVILVRSVSAIAKWSDWFLAIIVLTGAVLGTVTFLVGIFVVLTGVLLCMACSNLATSKQTGVSSC